MNPSNGNFYNSISAIEDQFIRDDDGATANATWSSLKIRDYVDTFVEGMDFKASCFVATIVDLTTLSFGASGISYDNATGTLTQVSTGDGVFGAIDGVSVPLLARLLVKSESNAVRNGIYVLSNQGVLGVTPWQLTRSIDCDEASEVSAGLYTYIESGSLAGQAYVLGGVGEMILGTDILSFQTFNTSGAGIAANTALIASNTLHISSTSAPHVSDVLTNPHAVTKAHVNLGNCDNTSDLSKPISTLTNTALSATNRILTSKIIDIRNTSTLIGNAHYLMNSNLAGTFSPFDGTHTRKAVTLPFSPDGVVMLDTEHVILASQLDPRENGLYFLEVVTNSLNRWNAINTYYYEGATYHISAGSTNANTDWYVLPDAPTTTQDALLANLSPIYISKYDPNDPQTAINTTGISTLTTDLNTLDTRTTNLDNTADLDKPISTASDFRMNQIEAGVTYKKSAAVDTSGAVLPNSNYIPGAVGTLEGAVNGALSLGIAIQGSRVVVRNQVDLRENGVYDVTDIGSAATKWILSRSPDMDGSIAAELSGGVVLTVTSPSAHQYVLIGAGIKIVNDPVLANNDDIVFTAFASSVPSALSIDSLHTSGVIDCGGALNVKNAALTTLSGGLTVVGIASLGTLSTLTVSGTGSVGGRLDVTGACEITGATNIIGALTGATVSNLTGRVATLEGGGFPDNIVANISINPDVNYGAVIGAANKRFTNVFSQYGDIEESLSVGSSTAFGNGKLLVNRGATNTIALDSTLGEISLKDVSGQETINIGGQTSTVRAPYLQAGLGIYPTNTLTSAIGSSSNQFLDLYTQSATISANLGVNTITCEGSISQMGGQVYTWWYGGAPRSEWTGNGNRIVFHVYEGQAQKNGSLAWIALQSDERLKTDITNVNIEEAAGRINSLRLVTYKWSPEFAAVQGVDPNYTWTGLISQEYYTTYPEPLESRPQTLIDLGQGEGEIPYYGLDKGISDFELIAAIQHQSKRADLAESRLLAIEARLAALENP